MVEDYGDSTLAKPASEWVKSANQQETGATFESIPDVVITLGQFHTDSGKGWGCRRKLARATEGQSGLLRSLM
jgi:hypothetical protein